MEIALNLVWVIIGLAGLYYGAEWLVRGAVGTALSAGISTLVVGLTVVAFGTSMPELIVSIEANLKGSGDISLGNVIGSNICNIGLVLAVAALMTPIVTHKQILKRELPLLIIVSLAFVAMLLFDNQIGRIEGAVLALGIAGYTTTCIRIAKANPDDPIASITDEVEEFGEGDGTGTFASNMTWIVIGLIVLAIGSNRLVTGGKFLAELVGVSEAVIALTLIAFGTSLPELATTIVACTKGETELAVGNAIGSCLFNLLCVIGFTAVIKPIASTAIAIEDLILMVAYPIVTFVLLKREQTLGRVAGLILLIPYALYVVYLGFRG